MQLQQKTNIRIGEQAWHLLHSEQLMGESYERTILRSLNDLKSLREVFKRRYQPIHVAKTTQAQAQAAIDPEPEPLIVEDEDEDEEEESE